jgi:hypothetical protein
MSTIIAAGFDVLADAERAEQRLKDAGISADYICKFRVNPPGEHAKLAIGGDHGASAGARHAHAGAAKGAAIGAAVGLAAGAAVAPFLGPAGVAAGVGVGAYTGSLVGSLKEIDTEPQPDISDVRPAETLVAVNIDGAGVDEDTVVRTFEECGARQIERAQGQWVDGEWADFDPTTSPQVIGGRDLSRRSGSVENRPSTAT